MSSNRKRLLVPTTMAQSGFDVLHARAEFEVLRYPPGLAPAELHALLESAVGIALSFTRFGQPELQAAPLLRVAARIGVGFDAVDVPALTARGVPLMVAGTANSTSVAEQAFFFMLALAKLGATMDRRVRSGVWHDRKSDIPVELAGKTVLIVGFGRIGSRVAPRCQAFGMQVLVYDPFIPADRIRAQNCEPVADLDAALPRADFLTIHCPRNANTEGLFNAPRLARLRPSAYLVNTARGGIVDEAALHDALADNRLAGAALDVFDVEPPDPANPLLTLPNIITAPHMAGVTAEAMAAMAAVTAQNMLGVLDGTPNRDNAVNPEVLAK